MKWFLGFIVVAALAAGGAWYMGIFKTPAAPAPAPVAQNTQTQTPAEPDNGLSAASDMSDAAFAQDTAAIDAQMKGSAQDSSDINSSMSDQAVAQSY